MKWPLRKLGELTSVISSGATPLGGSGTYLGSGPVLFIRSQNVQMGTLRLEDAAYVSEEIDDQLARTRVHFGDVLLNITGASIGRVAPFDLTATRANVNQHVCVIRPRPNLLHPEFLAHYIATADFQTHIQSIQSGGTRQALTFSQIARFEIPMPSLEEQRRIAAILDQADALRAKRRQALAKVDTLTQSLFLEMFGDPATNAKGWKVGTVQDLVRSPKSDVRCGPFGTQLKVAEVRDSGVPLFGIETAVKNQFDAKVKKFISVMKSEELRAFSAIPGDVLVTRMGTVGRACVVPEGFQEARFSYHLFRIRPDRTKCVPEFLASTISRSGVFLRQLNDMAHGAIMAGLSTENLRSVRFTIPPLELQERYLRRLSLIDRTRSLMADQGGLDMLLASLNRRAFRGEL